MIEGKFVIITRITQRVMLPSRFDSRNPNNLLKVGDLT